MNSLNVKVASPAITRSRLIALFQVKAQKIEPSKGETMMRYSKLFAWLALALGTSILSAQEPYREGRDIRREERQDLNRDYANAQRLRYQIAVDRQRLNEDRRCGRYRAAAEDARDLARDQRALDAQLRHIRSDRAEMSQDYRGNWRNR